MADLGRTLKYLYPEGGWEVGFDPHVDPAPKIVRWDLPVPQPSETQLEAAYRNMLLATAIAGIKAEASVRILNQFPSWKQTNMTARAGELSDLRHDRVLTEAESAERQALIGAFAWVKAVRTRSDELEAGLPALTTEQLAGFAPGSESWPLPA